MRSNRNNLLLLAMIAGAIGCGGPQSQEAGSCTFAYAPSWTEGCQVVESASFGASIVACRAPDGRHVVLARSPVYTQMLRDKVRQGGQIAYTSPKGFRAWRGGPEKWYSEVVLRSAQYVIKDVPSSERCGYAIESPTGEIAILAVNGPLKRDELEALVDSLTLSSAGMTSAAGR